MRRTSKILLIFSLLLTFSAHAKSVEFYLPELGSDQAPKKRTHVIITGKVQPNTPVKLSKKTAIFRKKEMKYFKTKKLLKKGQPIKVMSDKQGYFKFELYAPAGKIKLPVGVRTIKGKKKRTKKYLLSLRVNKKNVKVTNKKNLKQSPLLAKKYSASLGLGANYLVYNQASTQFTSKLSTFKAPSLYAGFKYRLSPRWSFNTSFSSSPGEANKAEGTIELGSNKTYSWNIISLEAILFPTSWSNTWLKGDGKFGILAGLQQHTVPFIQKTGNSNTEYGLDTNSLTMVALGGEYLLNFRKWAFDSFMRYQIPVASGDTFDHTPVFAFDGSLGSYYKLGKSWRLGLYWYGQWHSYKFKYTDKFDSSSVTGDQTLFYSNVEFRVAYDF